MNSKRKAVSLIGVASGLGAPKWAAGACAQGLPVLRLARLTAAPQRNGYACEWGAVLAPVSESSEEALPALLHQLAIRVADAVQKGILPVVIGGDHSIAAGTWQGAAQAAGNDGRGKKLGLLWIDAHLDAHTPSTSCTGNLHGMPLAALLGAEIAGFGGKPGFALDPRYVCIVGARSYEEAERQALRAMGVKIFGMDEINRIGLRAVITEALARVSGGAGEVQGESAFGITLDLDAIDPHDAPGVSTPEPDGIRSADLCDALRGIGADERLVAIEIAEFNPERDVDGRTARLVANLLDAFTAGSASELREWETAYGAHNYAPVPVVLSRGAGTRVWDTKGREYLDMMSAYSAVSFGHSHPRLVEALTQQAQRLAVTSRAYYNDRLPLLLRRLCALFGYEAALPVNTGLEAVETALKAARKWAYKVKGVATDQAEIIACESNFHGRSITIVGLSSEAQYRDGFGPFPPGLKRVPYGDAAALEAAITPQTAAFLVEAIQGEGGIILPPAGYLAACAAICQRHNVLLICDEVQTGLGRTGKLLACWHDDIRPDGIILGKALGGGLLPVSAFLADRRVMDVFHPGDHGSTFGGNALAAAVALEALDLLVELNLSARSARLGTYLLTRLRRIQSPLIREIRGRGLFIGIELDSRYVDAWSVCLKLLAHGVLSKDTHHTVVRIAPPLTVSREELDQAVERIAAALTEIERELPLRAWAA